MHLAQWAGVYSSDTCYTAELKADLLRLCHLQTQCAFFDEKYAKIQSEFVKQTAAAEAAAQRASEFLTFIRN